MITSSLKEKGLRVVGGTTLISEKKVTTDLTCSTEYKLGRWIKTMVNFEDYKALKKLAVDKDVSLAELLRQGIRAVLKGE